MTYTNILKQFSYTSASTLASAVSGKIVDSADPVAAANAIITSLGVAPMAEENASRLVAMLLVEYLDSATVNYTVEKAIEHVEKRYQVIAKKVPVYELRQVILTPLKAGQATTAPSAVADKKAAALVIFNRMKDNEGVTNNQIVIAISEELGITRGNASYYVYRNFMKK